MNVVKIILKNAPCLHEKRESEEKIRKQLQKLRKFSNVQKIRPQNIKSNMQQMHLRLWSDVSRGFFGSHRTQRSGRANDSLISA